MNDVKKGAVTAIIATAVTSAMILMGSIGNADNSQSVIGKDQPNSIEKMTVEIIQESDAVAEFVKVEISTKSESNNVTTKDASNAHLPPPPGPYSKEVTEVLVMPQAPQLSSPPVSPETPKESVVKKPEVPEAPKNVVEKPLQKEKAPVAPEHAEKLVIKLTEKDAPKMTTKIPNAPFAPEIRSLQPEPIKSPELPNNKLTTNQQIPKAPVAPKGNFLQKLLPKTNNNGQPIWMQMPGNPNGVRNMQQYRYTPMPVYPNYHYPQMPRYNGGYYFAPDPNQWMQRNMQMPMQQENMKQNQFLQGTNEQKGFSK